MKSYFNTGTYSFIAFSPMKYYFDGDYKVYNLTNDSYLYNEQ